MGKQSLLASGSHNKVHVWIKAAPAHADVVALAAAITRAVARLTGTDCANILKLLSASINPENEIAALATLQVKAFKTWPTSAWLIIDEYEWLSDSEASEEYIRLLWKDPLSESS